MWEEYPHSLRGENGLHHLKLCVDGGADSRNCKTEAIVAGRYARERR
jgi:hypothetical protein